MSDVMCNFFVGKMAELLVKGLLSTGPTPSFFLPIKVHPAACLEMGYIFFLCVLITINNLHSSTRVF